MDFMDSKHQFNINSTYPIAVNLQETPTQCFQKMEPGQYKKGRIHQQKLVDDFNPKKIDESNTLGEIFSNIG